MLTPEQKACRQKFGEENLDKLRANPEKSSQKLLQGMKHWSIIIIQRPNKSPYNGNTRGPLLSRHFVCNNQPEISWQQFFWDSEGVLLVEFMPHKTTITGDIMLPQWWLYAENIKDKRRGKLSTDVLLLHDNAPAQIHAHRGFL